MTANSKIATTTTKATQNKTHQQFRVVTICREFSDTGTYIKKRRTLEQAEDYKTVQVHDGFLGFSKHDSPQAKRKKQSDFFSDTKLEVPNDAAFQLRIAAEGGPIAFTFIRKVLVLESDRKTQQHLSMIAQCQQTLRDFKSRSKMYEIQKKLSSFVGMQLALSHTIMSQLGVSIASEGNKHSITLVRIIDHVKMSDSHVVMQDVLDAAQDHRTGHTVFGEFLAALSFVVDRDLCSGVHERRHSTVSVVVSSRSEAVSIRDLRDTLHEGASLARVPCHCGLLHRQA